MHHRVVNISSIQQVLPYYIEGAVVHGFGRGGKELGVPTANFGEDVVRNLPESLECGVYYGFAKISNDDHVHKMCLSVGWNPFYKNTLKTLEIHVMHKFGKDFYDNHLKIIMLGYIRPMSDFKSLEALIEAINNDIAISSQRLDEPDCLKYKDDPFFSAAPGNVGISHRNHTNNSIFPYVHCDCSLVTIV